MRKLYIILSFLIASVTCFSQSIVPRTNSSYTVMDSRGKWQYNAFMPAYADTTAANLQKGIDSLGAVIFTYNTMTLWVRSQSPKVWVEVGSGGGGGTWGSITGTLSNQTDLQNALNLKANLASPTFTGTVVIPSPFTLGATSVLTSGAELNFVDGVTSNIQTQLDLKAPLISPLFTTPRLASTSTINYVWTATDGSGNGSFQAIPSDNLIVVNAGSGTQTWFTSGDSLYMKMVKNTTFISTTTDTDSSLLLSLSATGTPSASTYLRGDNTWATIAGGGDVTKVGTPINNQLGVWTGDGTIEGDANLTFASSTLNIGVAGAATGIFTQSGVTSGTITFQPASAAGTYTLTWPTTDGAPNEFLQTNGSGVLTWAAGGGGSTDSIGTISRGIIQSATYTLTNTTTLQKLFDVGGTGELTVTANTTYQIECMFSLSAMSATNGNCGFDIIGAGTATLTNATWSVVGGRDGVTLATGSTSTGNFSELSAETGNIVTPGVGTNMFAVIKGIIRVNTGGTLIPSVNLTHAAAAVTGVNSYFKVTPIGSGSVTVW